MVQECCADRVDCLIDVGGYRERLQMCGRGCERRQNQPTDVMKDSVFVWYVQCFLFLCFDYAGSLTKIRPPKNVQNKSTLAQCRFVRSIHIVSVAMVDLLSGSERFEVNACNMSSDGGKTQHDLLRCVECYMF